MTTLIQKQSIGRGSRVEKLPVQQISLFEEPTLSWELLTVSVVSDPEDDCKISEDVASSNGLTITGSMWASQSYVDAGISDDQMLTDRLDELEKKLAEYIERDTKSTLPTNSYEGMVSHVEVSPRIITHNVLKEEMDDMVWITN